MIWPLRSITLWNYQWSRPDQLSHILERTRYIFPGILRNFSFSGESSFGVLDNFLDTKTHNMTDKYLVLGENQFLAAVI